LQPRPRTLISVVCSCCGLWAIESVTLDDIPRLKLSCRGYLVGYFTAIDTLGRELVRQGGPGLAEFRSAA
jgi:hypothetical protein